MKIRLSQIKKGPLIIAFFCGVLGLVVLNFYMKQQEVSIKERYVPKDIVEVVAAKRTIASGQTIKPNDVEVKKLPRQYTLTNAINSAEQIIGKIAQADIMEGEQIIYSKVGFAKPSPTPSITVTNLSKILPEGKRAITIPVDPVSSVANLIRPSDHVDVMVELTVPSSKGGKQTQQQMIFPLFQNILVVATGSSVTPAGTLTGKAMAPASFSSITLALDPQQTTFLAFVQQQGKIRLVLRAPGDNKVEPVTPADWDSLNLYLFGPPPEDEAKISDANQVEIYRGSGMGKAGE